MCVCSCLALRGTVDQLVSWGAGTSPSIMLLIYLFIYLLYLFVYFYTFLVCMEREWDDGGAVGGVRVNGGVLG